MRETIGVFLPVRAGSERIPDKNFRPFALGKSLLQIKIEQLVKVEAFSRIVVSSDHLEIVKLQIVALGLDDRVDCVSRPTALANGEALISDLSMYAAGLFEEETIAWTHATSPFFDTRFYENSVEKFFQSRQEGYDSLFTAKKIQSYLLDDKMRPINFELTGKSAWVSTQKLSATYEVDSAIFITSKDSLTRGVRSGKNPMIFVTEEPQSFDIDWPNQFALFGQLYESWQAEGTKGR